MDLGLDQYFKFILALVFVLALIALLAALARRMGFGYRVAGNRRGPRRLALVETLPLDAKHRLALVRRDSTEHLVLLGAEGDQVVERGIPAPDEDATAALAEPRTGDRQEPRL